MMTWAIIYVMKIRLVVLLLFMEKVEDLQTHKCKKVPPVKYQGKQTVPRCTPPSVIDLTSYDDISLI